MPFFLIHCKTFLFRSFGFYCKKRNIRRLAESFSWFERQKNGRRTSKHIAIKMNELWKLNRFRILWLGAIVMEGVYTLMHISMKWHLIAMTIFFYLLCTFFQIAILFCVWHINWMKFICSDIIVRLLWDNASKRLLLMSKYLRIIHVLYLPYWNE